MKFKTSKYYTDLLDTNYVAGFEDFRMEAEECFPKFDFSSIKLNIGATSSLLQTSCLLQTNSEDVNIKDDATTHPTQDNPTYGDNPQ